MRSDHEYSKYAEVLQGFRSAKDGKTFKAWQIRRGLTYKRIVSAISRNAQKEQARMANHQQKIHYEQPKQEHKSESINHSESVIEIPSLGLFDTTNPAIDPAEEDFRRRMQRKKRRGPRL